LVDDSGNLRLAGFGLSMILAEAGNLTFGSVQTWNTRWMAPEILDYPEQPEQPLKPTKTGDIYSFGCVMLQVRWVAMIPHSMVSHGSRRSFQEKSPTRGL